MFVVEIESYFLRRRTEDDRRLARPSQVVGLSRLGIMIWVCSVTALILPPIDSCAGYERSCPSGLAIQNERTRGGIQKMTFFSALQMSIPLKVSSEPLS